MFADLCEWAKLRIITTFGMSMNESHTTPILYSFRRCPYAMRARMIIALCDFRVALREVVLRDKPASLLASSAKATVPVLVLPSGKVLDESMEIIRWVLERNVADGLATLTDKQTTLGLQIIERNDGPFKHHLDRAKYPDRYDDVDPLEHRKKASKFIAYLEDLLTQNTYLVCNSPSWADISVFPFIRQFANHDTKWFDSLECPKVKNWLQGWLESPSFKGIMRKYKQWSHGDQELYF